MGITLKLTLSKTVWEDVGWIRVDEVWWSGGKYL
jgi:hypothetical protein